MVALVIHGGAWSIPPSKVSGTKRILERILPIASSMLESGKSALDAVEFAVTQLENDPLFDAGCGSYPNTQGEVEMDAIIVDGTIRDFGAVAAIKNVKNPIAAARKVLEATNHCMLVGDGATKFAHANGFDFVPDNDLAGIVETDHAMGTVGAIAIDAHGRIASATSTGGIPHKLPGRIGDTSLIGCGAIADDSIGGVSVSGEGESLMRIMISRVVLDGLNRGLSPDDAAKEAIKELEKKVDGKGGVVCLNKQGIVGCAFNTDKMAIAYIDKRGQIEVSV